MSETLTINDAARALQVSRRTVYHWIDSGLLVVDSVPWGSLRRMVVRKDSTAFSLTDRRKTDVRTAWKLAAAARKDDAA